MAKEDYMHFQNMEKRRKKCQIQGQEVTWKQRLFLREKPIHNRDLTDTLISYLVQVYQPSLFKNCEVLSVGRAAAQTALVARSFGARTITMIFPTYSDAYLYQHNKYNRYCYVADLNKGEKPPIVVSKYGFMFAVEDFITSPKAYQTLSDSANFLFVEGGFNLNKGLSKVDTEIALKSNFDIVIPMVDNVLNTVSARYDTPDSNEPNSRTLWLARR